MDIANINERQNENLQTKEQMNAECRQDIAGPRPRLMHELAQMHRVEGFKREEIAQKLSLSIEEVDALLAEPMLEQAYQDVIHETALQEKMQAMMLEPMLQELTLPMLIEKFARKNKFREKAAGDIFIYMVELSEFKGKA